MTSKQMIVTLGLLMIISNIALGIAPSLGVIGLAYPEVRRSTLQLIISLAAFASFGASLVAGKLQAIFSQKAVVMSGAFLLGLGSLPMFIQPGFNFLLCMSVLIGLGAGLMTSTMPAIIATYFSGDSRSNMLGLNTSLKAIGGMAVAALGGILASFGWYFSYAMFLFAFVGVVFAIFFLPNDKAIRETQLLEEQESSGETSADDGRLTLVSTTVIFVIILGMLVTLLGGVSQNNVALHIQEAHIGDAKVAGLALSCESLGGIAAGLIVTKLAKVLRSYTMIIGFIGMAAGQLLIATIHLPMAVFIGCLVNGISTWFVMTRILFLMTSVVKPAAIPMTAGVFSAATSLGFALSPLIINLISGLFSDQLATTSFFVGVGIVVILIVTLVVTQFEQRLLKRIPE